MINQSTIPLIALLLAGCAGVPMTIPEKVDIPVCPIAPTPTLPDRPALPISSMIDGNADNVLKAYAASVRALEGYAKELEGIIKSLKQP